MARAAPQSCLFFEHSIIPCDRMVIDDGHTRHIHDAYLLIIDSLLASLLTGWPQPTHEHLHLTTSVDFAESRHHTRSHLPCIMPYQKSINDLYHNIVLCVYLFLFSFRVRALCNMKICAFTVRIIILTLGLIGLMSFGRVLWLGTFSF